ncbi:MAG TPA: hypothetical protein VGJ62_06530 [Gemmatimonadaceae bacterium]|jgi:hypothetical protein
MTEDKFEEFLKKAAQGYNAPPARVPRDEMWSAIQAKRAAGPRVVYGGGATYIVGQRRFGTRVWLGAAAAAMLLVATGVGIGRWTATSKTQVAPSTTLPQQPVVVPTPGAVAQQGEPSAQSGSVAPSENGSRASIERTTIQGRNVASNNVKLPAPNGASALPPAAGPSSAYQLTTVQHLSEAEALLTSFRTRSNADQQMDAQLGAWARQLLSNTRLLLDSPVANDPQRRPLLEDLELVLVQIVQLSPGSTPQDRELIEKTLQQDHVMTRLRTAIPAGAQRGS